jgi:hypothetical protein
MFCGVKGSSRKCRTGCAKLEVISVDTTAESPMNRSKIRLLQLPRKHRCRPRTCSEFGLILSLNGSQDHHKMPPRSGAQVMLKFRVAPEVRHMTQPHARACRLPSAQPEVHFRHLMNNQDIMLPSTFFIYCFSTLV